MAAGSNQPPLPAVPSGQMLATSHLPLVVGVDARYNSTLRPPPPPPSPYPVTYSAPPALDVLALRSEDSRALSLRIVNPLALAVEAVLELDGWEACNVSASLLTSNSRDDANDDPEEPLHVAPRPFPVALASRARLEPLRFAPWSFVVVRLEGC